MIPTHNGAATDRASEIGRFSRLVDAARSAFVIAHASPDGDTLGSALAFTLSLRQRGIEARVFCQDRPGPAFAFLPAVDEVQPLEPGVVSRPDLIIVPDASDPERLGTSFEANRELFAAVPVVNVDHHLTNTRFGDVNIVDPTVSSVAELSQGIIQGWGAAIGLEVATCLLTGIVTDTIAFRTSSTSPATLRVAARLMESGADLHTIVEAALGSRPLRTLRLWGRVVDAARWHGDTVIWSRITPAMLAEAGASAEDGEGAINHLATTAGARATVLFTETEDGSIKVGLRSRPGTDVAEVARAFGGGGHRQAAGCTLAGPLDQAVPRVLALFVNAPQPVEAA